MNKRQREKIKQAKEITYQEAWNKISEFMNTYPAFGYSINCWTKSTMSPDCENKYCLVTIENKEYINHFIADKEWINK